MTYHYICCSFMGKGIGKLTCAKYIMNYQSCGGTESNGSSALMIVVQLYLKCSFVSTRQQQQTLYL
jgi:hypothetical protein